MAEGSVHLQVAKFNGENYPQWKFQIFCVLRAKGIDGLVNGKTIKPTANDEEIQKWMKLDATAMCVLTSAMELNQITLIQNCESAKEIMDKLNAIYEKKSETNKMILHEQFYQYKMKPGDSIAQHVSKVENLAQKIKDANETISDTAITTKILSSLPSKFLNFRQAWLSLQEDKQTLHNLTARLLDEEANLEQIEQTDEALTVTNWKAHGKRIPEKNSKKAIRCYNCNKKGHYARDCRGPKKQFKDPTDNSINSAFTAREEIEALISNSDSSWLMDSGASRHMTSTKAYFSTLQKTHNLKIRLGNDKQLAVEGIGTVLIEKLIDGKWCDGSLEDVWYVPELRRNLFSEGAITKRGFSVTKVNDKAEIRKNNTLVGVAVRTENNLYKMLIRVKENAAKDEVNITSGSLKEWHERLGHINCRYLKEIFTKKLASDVSLTDNSEFFCEGCVFGKQHKLKFAPISRQVTDVGDFCFIDLCGPMSVESIGGARYFLLIKDNNSGYRVVNFIKNKSDAFECVKDYLEMCKNKFGVEVKRVRVDNGREFVNKQTKEYLRKRGIIMETTGSYCSEQNGRIERENRTVVESARAMLYTKDVPLKLWAEAVSTAVYLLNRTPSKQTGNSTPYELWTGKKPTINHTKVFGCEAYLHIPDTLRKKLEKKSEKLLFIGYEGSSTNYRLFNPVTNKVKVSRNVIFNENSTVRTPRQNTILIDCSPEMDEKENDPSSDEIEEQNQAKSAEKSEEQESPEKFYSPIHDSPAEGVSSEYHQLRRKQSLKPPSYLQDYHLGDELNFTEIDIPNSYEEAMESKEKDSWKEAINEELTSLEMNNAWELVPMPANKNIVGSRWVFKIKPTPDAQTMRFKARLCARGFSQTEGVDFGETFAPTTRYSTVRLLLAFATQKRLEILQFDVKTAFLYGELDEEIFMKPPTGVPMPEGTVCRLKKSIYGLKQSPRCWNAKFSENLSRIGLRQCETDKCLYLGKIRDETVVVVLYVDDGLIMSRKMVVIEEVLEELKNTFKLTVCEPKFFVGLELNRNTDKTSLTISVSNFINRLLNRFKLTDAIGLKTPSDPGICLTDPVEIETKKEVVPYRELVGSLIFLSVAARPDIAYITSVLSRYFNNHGQKHWKAAKRVLRYLKTTRDLGIEYHISGRFELIGYSDSDFAGDLENRRSTSGYIFLINGSAITWKSQRQSIVTCSTTEAEYVAASETCKEAMWLKQLCYELGERVWPVKICVDNQSAIKLIKNPVFHNRSKHIDVRYHFIREKFCNGDISVDFVPSKDQIADILTKSLSYNSFVKLRTAMGLY